MQSIFDRPVAPYGRGEIGGGGYVIGNVEGGFLSLTPGAGLGLEGFGRPLDSNDRLHMRFPRRGQRCRLRREHGHFAGLDTAAGRMLERGRRGGTGRLLLGHLLYGFE